MYRFSSRSIITILFILIIVTGVVIAVALYQGLRYSAIPTEPGPKCQTQGHLPDYSCTPGATNPAVTQENIKQTICKAGWTATVRPPQSVTNPIKIERMRAYGVGSKESLYELDHLIPLELGGAPNNVANFWPELLNGPEGARIKDKTENSARAAVCNGQMPLADAQVAIANNWIALCKILKADPTC